MGVTGEFNQGPLVPCRWIMRNENENEGSCRNCGHTVKATKGEVVEVVLSILDNNVAPT